MAKIEISTKRVAINKANAQMVAVVGAAAFLTIFCLFAAKAAWQTNRYQARVTSVKEKAHNQLVQNTQAFDKLKVSYKAFDGTTSNVIGGATAGIGDKDGSNSQIVLDALPSSYDFPALASSLEKLLTANSFKVSSISGTDDQVNQQTNISSPSPQAVPMPFSFSVTDANYASVGQLIKTLQQSIRPIQIDSISISGGSNSMTLSVNAHTYYQPGKNLDIKKQVVK